MSKIVRYISAYALWIVDLGLSGWLIYLSRTVLLGVLALSNQVGEWEYSKLVNLIDRVFTVVLGLGWLVLAIVIEDKFRTAVKKGDLLNRFIRFTGPLLLSIFGIDLVLFWLQGSGSWSRWLILTAELGVGIALVVSGKKKSTPIHR